MYKEKIKGQTSIEILAILGVLVVGSIILGSFYISSVNKKTDETTNLSDVSTGFEDWLDDESGSLPPASGGDCTVASECGSTNNQCTEYDCDNGNCVTENLSNGSACRLYGWECLTEECTAGSCGATNNCPSGQSCTINGCESGEPVCGNDVVEYPEQCDNDNFNGVDCDLATNGQYPSGSLECLDNCTTIGTDNCTAGVPDQFTLDANPDSANGYVDIGYNGMFLALTLNNSEYVDLSVSVKKGFSYTDECSINGNPILVDGFDLGTYYGGTSIPMNIICINAAEYIFTFEGVDNAELTDIDDFTFTTTVAVDPTNAYALCSNEVTNANGTFSFCVNDLKSTTTKTSGVGELIIYVNQPDRSERSDVCESVAGVGSLCISIG